MMNLLSSPEAITAIGIVVAVVLSVVWPAAGSVWIKLLPAVKQIPVIVKALQDAQVPGDLKEEAAITKTIRKAGPLQTAIIKASGGRDAVRHVVRAEARKLLSSQGIDRNTTF